MGGKEQRERSDGPNPASLKKREQKKRQRLAEQFPGYDYPGYTNNERRRQAGRLPVAAGAGVAESRAEGEEGRRRAAGEEGEEAGPRAVSVAAGAEGAQEGGQDASGRVPEDDAAVVAQGEAPREAAAQERSVRGAGSRDFGGLRRGTGGGLCSLRRAALARRVADAAVRRQRVLQRREPPGSLRGDDRLGVGDVAREAPP